MDVEKEITAWDMCSEKYQIPRGKYDPHRHDELSSKKMHEWKKPSDERPKCDYGDRVVCIVGYIGHGEEKVTQHVVIFVATWYGFEDLEDHCFDILDVELWMLEKDFIENLGVVDFQTRSDNANDL